MYKNSDLGKSKFRFKNKLLSFDATVIDLCASLFDWAKFRRTKGAVKLHLLLDHEGYLPRYVHISEGKVHEATILKKLRLCLERLSFSTGGWWIISFLATWQQKMCIL